MKIDVYQIVKYELTREGDILNVEFMLTTADKDKVEKKMRWIRAFYRNNTEDYISQENEDKDGCFTFLEIATTDNQGMERVLFTIQVNVFTI